MRLWLLMLLVFSTVSQALTLEGLQQQLVKQEFIRSEFTQVRTIKSLPLPLVSKGEVLIAQKEGLLWLQDKPFPMVLILNESKMVQITNGQEPEVITADKNPQMFQFNHLLRALFQADMQALEQSFSIDFKSAEGGSWSIHLIPISTPLDKIFQSIDLFGDSFLQNITVTDKQGDLTKIELYGHTLAPQALTESEREFFAIQ